MIPFAGFTQSKKELQLQLATQQMKMDSLRDHVKRQQRIVDTLSQAYVNAQQKYLKQEEINIKLATENNELYQRILILEKENQKLKEKQLPQNKSEKGNTVADAPATKESFEENPFTSGIEQNRSPIPKDNRNIVQIPQPSNIESDENRTMEFIVSIN